VASAVYYGLVALLVGLPVTDTQTGMKLFRREALQWALDRMLVKRFAFDVEVLSIAHAHGYRVAEAPIRHALRRQDRQSHLVQRARTVMLDTLAIFYRLRVAAVLPERAAGRDAFAAAAGLRDRGLARRRRRYLTDCLAGLARQSYPAIETIVLPDAPAPGLSLAARRTRGADRPPPAGGEA